jgi:hypothetical protein
MRVAVCYGRGQQSRRPIPRQSKAAGSGGVALSRFRLYNIGNY